MAIIVKPVDEEGNEIQTSDDQGKLDNAAAEKAAADAASKEPTTEEKAATDKAAAEKAAAEKAAEKEPTTEEKAATDKAAADAAATKVEIDDKVVLDFIGKKLNKQVNSFDELTSEDLPEDVSSFLKFKKETGRGLTDYMFVQRDLSKVAPDQLLKEFFLATEQGLDEEDVDILMKDYDVSDDQDPDLDKKKIARKKAIAKATEHFSTLQEKYKAPDESSEKGLSPEEKEELETYKETMAAAKTQEEEIAAKREVFAKKTDELLNDEFKGFEFEVEGEKLVFLPDSLSNIKEQHKTPMAFVRRFLDEKGMLKDAKGYHRSLAMALNPDAFAKFFYEQGVAKVVEKDAKESKNIQMNFKTPQTFAEGLKVREVDDNQSGGKLKIRK